MQWVCQVTGQAGDRAAHLVYSGAVGNLVVKDRRRVGCGRAAFLRLCHCSVDGWVLRPFQGWGTDVYLRAVGAIHKGVWGAALTNRGTSVNAASTEHQGQRNLPALILEQALVLCGGRTVLV